MTSDMRRDVRYQIAALVSFWWSYQGETPNAGQGVTRDISQGGVWIVSDSVPPSGAKIQMRVTLPKLVGSHRSTTLEGEGIVVRSKAWDTPMGRDDSIGFGASVRFYLGRIDDENLLDSWSRIVPASAHCN